MPASLMFGGANASVTDDDSRTVVRGLFVCNGGKTLLRRSREVDEGEGKTFTAESEAGTRTRGKGREMRRDH